jgi:hypothetical protein
MATKVMSSSKEIDRAFFTPTKVRSRLPANGKQLWPMGDLLPKQPLPAEIDTAKLDSIGIAKIKLVGEKVRVNVQKRLSHHH